MTEYRINSKDHPGHLVERNLEEDIVWLQHGRRSQRPYGRAGNAVPSERKTGNSSGSESVEHEGSVDVQERYMAPHGSSSISSDSIQREGNTSSTLLAVSHGMQAESSQRPRNPGRLSFVPCWEFPQTRIADPAHAQGRPPELRLGNKHYDIDTLGPNEHELFHEFYTRQNIPFLLGDLASKHDPNINGLYSRLSRISKGLVEKGHRPIVHIRGKTIKEKETKMCVWEGPDAPIRKIQSGVELRQHSISGKRMNGEYEVIGLREAEYRILAHLFVRGNLGVAGSEIREIMNADGNKSYLSDEIFRLQRRLQPLGLTISRVGELRGPCNYYLEPIE